jgi:hypothetical protein
MKKFDFNLAALICLVAICLISACQKHLKTAPSSSTTTASTAVVTTVAGNQIGGDALGGMADGTGTAASFYEPFGITVDAQGNFYLADTELGLIRKMTSSFAVTTLAGKGTSGYTDGTGSAAAFELPYGIVADKNGNLYVSDTYNAVIGKVTPSGSLPPLRVTLQGEDRMFMSTVQAMQPLLYSHGELPLTLRETYMWPIETRSARSRRKL